MSEDPIAGRYFTAMALLEGGDPEAARRRFEMLTCDLPHFAPAWDGLARSWAALDEFRQADRCFRRAVKLDPRSWRIPLNWGLALRREGKSREALRRLRRAVKLGPESRTARVEVARCLLELGQAGRAEAALLGAQQLPEHPQAPDDAEILLELARARHACGRLKEADETFQQACLLRPDEPRIHYHWALCLESAGEAEAAMSVARRARGLARPGARERLVAARLLLERCAFNELDSELALLEGDPALAQEVAAIRARAHLEAGDHVAAQAEALRALSLGQVSPAAIEQSLEVIKLAHGKRGAWRGFRVTLRVLPAGGGYYRTFLVLAADASQAQQLAEELQAALEESPWELEEIESFPTRGVDWQGVFQVRLDRHVIPGEGSCGADAFRAWARP